MKKGRRIIMKNLTDNELEEILAINDEDLAELLSALSNKSRLQILKSLLGGAGEFRMLLEVTGLSKTALAHHLERLVENDLLKHLSRGEYKISKDGRELLRAIVTAYSQSQRRRKADAARHAAYIAQRYSKDKKEQEELKVQFVRLMPMRVASFNSGICKSPEEKAWEKLRSWAEPRGLLVDLDENPVFGFNNPSPSPGQKEYGYEFWIRIPSNFEEEGIKVKDIPERLYAVTRCVVDDPMKDIPEGWKKLVKWVKEKSHRIAKVPCLEKVVSPSESGDDFILDLYLPIKE
ncbi:MAG: ArsR family transcriptional regulator [Candidatus Heimdallarchaeota archaeon]|nr:ArsR family transcriptional regulator [Candidatus Heimdallarchaeota archaeon]